ncbi:MAG: hypothetical protein JXM70_07075 [Pirellulales bacterium]|nr:hypothetical protein [Pirellulales bacterium]
MRKIPIGTTLRKHAKDIGRFAEFKKLREDLKLQGMEAREAAVRAARDLEIEEKWAEWNKAKNPSDFLSRSVLLTPPEKKELIPGYTVPSITKGATCGDAAMSFAEQIQWAKRKVAQVRAGGDPPMHFPNEDVMYWYQRAVSNESAFDKIVEKIESPTKEVDDAWLRDGEMQIEELERQLKEAIREAEAARKADARTV